MDKKERQSIILALIKEADIANQMELVKVLKDKGVPCTQASISRDLAELRIHKVDGHYKSPEIRSSKSHELVGKLTVDRAGDHLIVIRTGPGSAQAAAMMIDRAKIKPIVGTVAGDDTVFIAVKNRDDQNYVIKSIHEIFMGLY